MSQLAQEKQVNLGTSARLNALSQYVLRISFSVGIHKNISVSGTKLTLGLRVGFISSHLTVDKLFPVNPRAFIYI